VVHLFNGTGMILRHLNFPAPPPGLSVSYNQRLVAPLGYCIQLVFYQTMPALCEWFNIVTLENVSARSWVRFLPGADFMLSG
jgi:hypothetical protein